MLLLEVLDEGDDERALGQQHRGHPPEHCDGLIGQGNFEICLRHKGRAVELLPALGQEQPQELVGARGQIPLDDAQLIALWLLPCSCEFSTHVANLVAAEKETPFLGRSSVSPRGITE